MPMKKTPATQRKKKGFRFYFLLFLLLVAVWVAGYLFLGNSAVDIHMHDTFFKIRW
jgi:multidrug resistance efflux pump